MRRLLLAVLFTGLVTPAFADTLALGRHSLGATILGSEGDLFFATRHGGAENLLLVAFSAQLTDYSKRGDWSTLPTPPAPSYRSQFDVAAGPGLRWYSRQDERLQPYWSLIGTADFGTARTPDDPGGIHTTLVRLGATIQLASGAEYFTPWSFSAAVDASLASLRYQYDRLTTNIQASPLGQPHDITTQSFSAAASLRPRLLVRVHF